LSTSPLGTQAAEGLALEIRGAVQGIGFRPWILRTARALGLRGRVRNLPGAVEVEAFGSGTALRALRKRIEASDLPGLTLEHVAVRALLGGSAPPDFRVERDSAARAARGDPTPALVPDLPVCRDCLDELRDASSRRYRYPFTHCARCGPRYTISRLLPWDRAHTAMADFPLCETCAAEYADPDDRRFHAEGTSCPRCGPRLLALAPGGEARAGGAAALELARETLRTGGALAVLGLGGFQLACDATCEAAVSRLRRRKRRGRKPFAVMVESLAEAEKHAALDPDERALLGSIERPIAIVKRRPDSPLARALAPGSPLLGLMLPTTPLHALLLEDAARPLVMTSGNRSGEPIAHRVEDAVERLGDVADLILAHDRAIEHPCDDSVVRVAARAPLLLRRARGFVPRPIRLARPVQGPVLAVGAHWSNAACLVVGDRAWPGVHVGDLESPESLDFLERSIDDLLAWVGVEPEIVAHDAHPHYESTRLARRRFGARCVAVQHHHAHLTSVLAESRETGPALGLVWDGTGLGDDGASWGGELLLGGADGVRRLATLRPLRLAGGDRAVREVWRIALAALDDAFAGAPPPEALALLAGVAGEGVAALLASGLACPRAHGMGRLFDAVGSLVLGRREASFQGEVALALESEAQGCRGPAYPFALDRDASPWQLDWRPALRALVADLLAGEAAHRVAQRFHGTLIDAGVAALRQASRAFGASTVALSGGCFQNRILVEGLVGELAAQHRVLRHRQLPPGDGGLALGQALVADAQRAAARRQPTREASAGTREAGAACV
jgi:hydrogenase maturation protein HypF